MALVVRCICGASSEAIRLISPRDSGRWIAATSRATSALLNWCWLTFLAFVRLAAADDRLSIFVLIEAAPGPLEGGTQDRRTRSGTCPAHSNVPWLHDLIGACSRSITRPAGWDATSIWRCPVDIWR